MPSGSGPVGSVHYHAAVKLAVNMRFAPAKSTLREQYQLPNHFSCTHTQVWSAVRHGYIATATEPDVDDDPHVWPGDKEIDLLALSQQPYEAAMWRGYIATATKPDVDDDPHVWPGDKEIELLALSQQPYEAAMWRKGVAAGACVRVWLQVVRRVVARVTRVRRNT